MNSKVNPDWRNAGYEWYRAIWVECAEMMDHYGWKWWKKQTPDIEQVKLELVDIWHFGLSILLSTDIPKEELVDYVQNWWVIDNQTTNNFKEYLEQFASIALKEKGISINHFSQLCNLADLSFDELYTSYVGKNVLNFFRQDNGYKTGTYRKHWHDGREDNEHLVEVIKSLDTTKPEFKDELYTELNKRYNSPT